MRHAFLKSVRRNPIGRYFYSVCFEYSSTSFKKIHLEELKWIDSFPVAHVSTKRFEECEILILSMFHRVSCFPHKPAHSLTFENTRSNATNDETSEKKKTTRLTRYLMFKSRGVKLTLYLFIEFAICV